MATTTRTTPPELPEPGQEPRHEWSIDGPKVEIPDQANALPAGALMLVVTDDGKSEWTARINRVAIELARSVGARILFYDRSAESRLTNGYASGPWSADTKWSHGERMLESEELHVLGRGYLGEYVGQAREAGIEAWAWLPRTIGRAAVAEAVRRFGVDLVLVPAEVRDSLRETRRRWPWQRQDLNVPVLAAAADGSVRDWQLATELSRVEFSARQFGFLTVRGHFSDFEVRLEFDEAKPEATRVEARIVAASVGTGLGIRDRDLRSPNFFDVERHPYISFTSTRVTRTGDEYTIAGDLEIKGRRREVELRGSFHGVGREHGYRRATMSATAVIDRRDWDVTGGPMIADRVTLSIRAVAVRASAEQDGGSDDPREAASHPMR